MSSIKVFWALKGKPGGKYQFLGVETVVERYRERTGGIKD